MRIFKKILSPLSLSIYASIGYILCLLSDKSYIGDMAVHWRLHMAGASLALTLIFLCRRRALYALWMLLLTLGFAFPAFQIFAPAPEPEGNIKAKFSILQFNVLYSNDELAASIPWIIEQNADIVILQEINKARALELEALKKHYNWSQIKLNSGREAFGMAIFSNLPVTKFDYIDLGESWNYYTLTELLVGGIKLHLYEIHTASPKNVDFYRKRNGELAKMTEILAKDETPYKLLVGDLNTTVYSPEFSNILTLANLHHAQQGYHLEGTWPSIFPAPLRIGIDHILASKQIKIENRAVKMYQGSDHLPVVTNLALYEEPNVKQDEP
jgi:endonuclease/exonuclease/phosphatase (EEP) superfamily protein YafD